MCTPAQTHMAKRSLDCERLILRSTAQIQVLQVQHARVVVSEPQALHFVRRDLSGGADLKIGAEEALLRRRPRSRLAVVRAARLQQQHTPRCIPQLPAQGQVPAESVLLVRLQGEARRALGEPSQREDPAAGKTQGVEACETAELALRGGATSHAHANKVGPAGLPNVRNPVQVPVTGKLRRRGPGSRRSPLAERLRNPDDLRAEPLVDGLVQLHGLDEAVGPLEARVHLQGPPETFHSLAPLACGLVTHPHACEATEVLGLQLEHFSAVQDGALEVLEHVVGGGPLVPAFCVVRDPCDHLGKQADSALKLLHVHQSGSLSQSRVHLFVSRPVPCAPQGLLRSCAQPLRAPSGNPPQHPVERLLCRRARLGGLRGQPAQRLHCVQSLFQGCAASQGGLRVLRRRLLQPAGRCGRPARATSPDAGPSGGRRSVEWPAGWGTGCSSEGARCPSAVLEGCRQQAGVVRRNRAETKTAAALP
mmetsp:Transcript_107025/g.330660  ORF Transcript_107025/g.330660 Transcript_107025/m.330660 type:complete len:478 (+) Transcript_107025:39-1472(+)